MLTGLRNLIIVSCVCSAILSLSGCRYEGHDTIERIKKITLTKELAIERVLQTLGLPSDQVSVTASQVTLTEQLLPCIKSSVTKDAWRVDLDNVTLTLTNKDGMRTVTNPYIKSLTVYLSSETGQVMKVVSSAPDAERSIRPFPSVRELEEKMRCFREVYVRLPKAAPKVRFTEALKQSHTFAHLAKQIVAYYVVVKGTDPKTESHERTLWVIHERGLPPRRSPRPHWAQPETLEDQAGCYERSFIDPETGQWLGADNVEEAPFDLEN